MYRSFDVLSPWLVGRFRDNAGAAAFYADRIAGDLEEVRRLGVDLMPVVFPGFSWRNLKGTAPLNEIPRRSGSFLWHQVEQALASGSTILYGAHVRG